LLQINRLVDDMVAGELAANEPVATELPDRPVRLRKRIQIAIEAEDEPAIR